MAELWPASLPQVPVGDSVSYTPWENSIRSQMDAGAHKLRRRFTAVGDDVTLALICTRDQVEALQEFYETTLKTVLPFTWRHFRKPNWPQTDYRFKNPPKFSPAGGAMWRAELELERLPASYAGGPAAEPGQAAAQSIAPSNTVEPTISGSTSPGSTLTATPGTWNGSPTPVVVGQWQLKTGGIWEDILNAGALNYTTQNLGPHRYKEKASNNAGFGSVASSPITISDGAQAPADAPPVNTVAPTVTGSGTVGEVLTSGTGDWTGVPVPTYTFQWQTWGGSDWVNVAGATASTYTPTEAVDTRCAVTGTNTSGSAVAYSNVIAVTAAETAPTNAVAPVVSGGDTVGATLTTTDGTWSGNPAPTFTYQWQRYTAGAFADIASATTASYVTAHEGDHRCKVTASNGVLPNGEAFSNAVNIGTAADAPTMETAPIISGNAYSGSTITALPGLWNGTSPISYAYQWQVRDSNGVWSNVASATTASYTTPSAAPYRCEITASNAGGTKTAVSNTMTVSAAPTGGSSEISKTFTGAASDNLDVTTHDSTLTYFDNPNVATELLVIKQASNSVHGNNTSGSLQAVYPNTRTFGARQKVTATIYQTDTTSHVATFVRGADYDNILWVQWGAGGSTVVQKVAGVVTNYSLGANAAAGDVVEVEINEAGTQVICKINGVHTAGGTYPSPITLTTTQPAGNRAGAGLWSATTGELSSFTAFTVDDFSGSAQVPQLDYAPQIIGKPTVNETLTSTRGVWFASPEPTYAYLWQRWDGAAWVTAAGTSNAADYVPTVDGDFRCRVTATNSEGSSTGTSPSVTVSGGTQGTGTYTQARILFDEMHGGAEPMVATLEFRATVGGAKLTGTAFASSEAGAITAASLAFDADAGTYWEPALDLDAVPYLGQVFASGQAIAQIALTFPNVEASYTAAAPRTFRLQGWDGAQWTTLKTVTNDPAWTPGETRTFNV